jgi:hypothetical protein
VPVQEFTRPAATFTAVQWTGDNLAEVADFVGDALVGSTSGLLAVQLSEEVAVMKPRWWVYRIDGTLGICSDGVARRDGWMPVA